MREQLKMHAAVRNEILGDGSFYDEEDERIVQIACLMCGPLKQDFDTGEIIHPHQDKITFDMLNSGWKSNDNNSLDV